MTVASVDRQGQRKLGDLVVYDVIGSDIIFGNTLVTTPLGEATNAGYAKPGANLQLEVFIGVSDTKTDNSSGSIGDLQTKVWKTGSFVFEFDGTPVRADIGQKCYIVDDNTVGLGGTANTSYGIYCGEIVATDDIEEELTSTQVRVRIDKAVDQFPETFEFVMLNDAVITRGGIASADAATPAEVTSGADTASFAAVGIAIETVDNAADGLSIRVIQSGAVILLDGTQAIANYSVGDAMYMDGARAVDLAGATANVDSFVGRVVRLGGTNDVYVNLNVKGEAASG